MNSNIVAARQEAQNVVIDQELIIPAYVAAEKNNNIAAVITNKIAQEMYNENNEKYALAARFFRKSAATFTIAVIVLMHKNQTATEIAKIVQAQNINKGHASYKKCLSSVRWAADQMSISLV